MEELFSPNHYDVARVLTPFGFAFLIGIFLTCWGIDLTRGRIRELFVLASCLMTAGAGAMAAFDETNETAFILLSFMGMLGVGALCISPIVVLTDISSDEALGTIVGLGVSVRLIIGQAGFTLFFSIVKKKLKAILPGTVALAVRKLLPEAQIPIFIKLLVAKDFEAIKKVPGVTAAVMFAAKTAVDHAYIVSFKGVYLVSIAAGVIALIASALLPNIRSHLTDRVAVDIH